MCGLVMGRVRHRVVEGGHQGATLHRKHRYFPPCFVSNQNTLHPSTFIVQTPIIGPINNESFYCSHTFRLLFVMTFSYMRRFLHKESHHIISLIENKRAGSKYPGCVIAGLSLYRIISWHWVTGHRKPPGPGAGTRHVSRVSRRSQMRCRQFISFNSPSVCV